MGNITLRLMTPEEVAAADLARVLDDALYPHRNYNQVRCPCGRFAHFVKAGYVYLGDNGQEWRMTVRCAAHGEMEVY